MNKRERVKAALRGEVVDRVPGAFWMHFPPESCNGHAMARAHLDFYRSTDPDFLKVMNDNPYELVGVDRIDRPADWRRLRPATRGSRVRVEYLDGLKEILDAVGQEAPVIVTVFNPFATANDNRSGQLDFSDATFDGITAHLREDPGSTCRGLNAIAESLAEFSRDCIEAGAAGIFFSANGGEHGRFSPDEFRDLIEASDRLVLEAAREAGGEFNLLHVCGAGQRLQSYADYPVHAVNWAPQMDNPTLAEGRKIFRQAIVGGMVQAGVLATGPRPMIEDEARRALAEAGARHFMLSAGCAVAGDVPAEHFVWAREALATGLPGRE